MLSRKVDKRKPLGDGKTARDLAQRAAVLEMRISAARESASGAAMRQGLTLVHVRAQLKQLQDTFMSKVGLYGGQRSSS